MTIRLHCFGESGNAYKAALTLELCTLDWEPVFVDFFNGETRTPEWRARMNEMGEVPVLEHDETRLTQSSVIQSYIATLAGRFGGIGEDERREVLRWQFWDTQKLSGQAGMRRFLMNFLPEEKRPAEVIGFLGQRLEAAYRVLDAHLADRNWIVGQGATIADLGCCGYLFYDEPFGFDRAAWPAIDRWLREIETLPGWKHPYDLMPRSAA